MMYPPQTIYQPIVMGYPSGHIVACPVQSCDLEVASGTSYPWRSVLWFLTLVFVGWPLSVVFSALYIVLSPFGPCCNCVRIITDALLFGVTLPCICSENMILQSRYC